MKCMMKKKSVSLENVKQLHATLGKAKKELKEGSRSYKKQKWSSCNILLTERGNHCLYAKMLKVKMTVFEEGNMKFFTTHT
jgi:hypothetical protein